MHEGTQELLPAAQLLGQTAL